MSFSSCRFQQLNNCTTLHCFCKLDILKLICSKFPLVLANIQKVRQKWSAHKVCLTMSGSATSGGLNSQWSEVDVYVLASMVGAYAI